MSNEVRMGPLRLKFLVNDADDAGKLTMFEMTVPVGAEVPAAHFHKDVEKVRYGLDGALTLTLEGAPYELKNGDALFAPRGAIHRFDNLGRDEARALVTLTPGAAGRRDFEEMATLFVSGGPADMNKVKAVMDRDGLIAV